MGKDGPYPHSPGGGKRGCTHRRIADRVEIADRTERKDAPKKTPVIAAQWAMTGVHIENRRSGQVVAIEVHHLGPRSREVLHERLLRVVTCIDFRERPELGV